MTSFKRISTSNKQEIRKLTAQFETVLKSFEKISQAIESKQKAVLSLSDKGDSPMKTMSRSPDSSGPEHTQQQDGNIEFLEYNADDIEHRKKDIQILEQDVREVGEMFKDLNVLVNEQQVNIDVIENNVSNAKSHTAEGHEELVKAEEYQKKARQKMCCLLCLVIIILVIIIVPIVVTKK